MSTRLSFGPMHTRIPQTLRAAPCDLCGGHQFGLLASVDRCHAALDTVICQTCGLIAHARIPSEAELAEYYRRQYRWEYHGEVAPSPHRVVREWNRGGELLRRLHPYVTPSDHVMEVGSGIGCTVSHFARAGYRATGVEPGEGFRRYAIQQLGVRVREGVLADLPRRPMADVILLVHVLEHLPSPSEALAHIRALLHVGGRLYIEVPNAGAPHAAPGKMFHRAHIYNFTRDTLEMLAAKAHFRVRQWLSRGRDKNLRVLLEGADLGRWHLIPGSYQRAAQATVGITRWQYFLRASYLRHRMRTLVGHQADRLLASWRVSRILGSAPVADRQGSPCTAARPQTPRPIGREIRITTPAHRVESIGHRDDPAHAAHSS